MAPSQLPSSSHLYRTSTAFLAPHSPSHLLLRKCLYSALSSIPPSDLPVIRTFVHWRDLSGLHTPFILDHVVLADLRLAPAASTTFSLNLTRGWWEPVRRTISHSIAPRQPQIRTSESAPQVIEGPQLNNSTPPILLWLKESEHVSMINSEELARTLDGLAEMHQWSIAVLIVPSTATAASLRMEHLQAAAQATLWCWAFLLLCSRKHSSLFNRTARFSLKSIRRPLRTRTLYLRALSVMKAQHGPAHLMSATSSGGTMLVVPPCLNASSLVDPAVMDASSLKTSTLKRVLPEPAGLDKVSSTGSLPVPRVSVNVTQLERALERLMLEAA